MRDFDPVILQAEDIFSPLGTSSAEGTVLRAIISV